MKSCEKFAPLLSAFVDGELTEEENAEVLTHVSECEECRRLLDELTALHAAFGGLEEVEPPADFAETVMGAIRAEKAAVRPRREKRSMWHRWAPMAACAALVLLAALSIPRMSGNETGNDMAMPAENGQSLYTAGAETSAADDEAEDLFVNERCDAVQYAAPDAASERDSVAKSADTASISYGCETVTLGESGEEGALLVADYGAVVLELYGADATDYVLENGGVKADDAGYYYVPIDALRDLSEGLSMMGVQAETLSHAPAEAEWVLCYPDDYSEVPQP